MYINIIQFDENIIVWYMRKEIRLNLSLFVFILMIIIPSRRALFCSMKICNDFVIYTLY